MQRPGQKITNHCISRLSDRWERLGWAGVGEGQRQQRESGQVLEDLVLQGSGQTKSQLLSELCYNQS